MTNLSHCSVLLGNHTVQQVPFIVVKEMKDIVLLGRDAITIHIGLNLLGPEKAVTIAKTGEKIPLFLSDNGNNVLQFQYKLVTCKQTTIPAYTALTRSSKMTVYNLLMIHTSFNL